MISFEVLIICIFKKYGQENNLISKKLQVTDAVLGTRNLSVKGGWGDSVRETSSVKLPSRDVYQGFLDHEAEGL